MSLADLFSLVRIPLGAAFLFVADRPLAALVLLALAGASDVLDGWAARRGPRPVSEAPHRGDWLDPFCDKVFVGAVMAGLYTAYAPPSWLLALTVTRELLQLVSLVIYRLVPRLRRVQYQYRAHALGKATTVVQFLTAGAFVLQLAAAPPLALLSALLGAVTVALYVARARALARAAAD